MGCSDGRAFPTEFMRRDRRGISLGAATQVVAGWQGGERPAAAPFETRKNNTLWYLFSWVLLLYDTSLTQPFHIPIVRGESPA
jgi:hypothetical protein